MCLWILWSISKADSSAADLARLWDWLTTSTHLIETISNDVGGTAASAGKIPQHRVLIFCQMKKMLDIIEHDPFKLQMQNVTYMHLVQQCLRNFHMIFFLP
ncbi:uncharacterized protein VP01_5177g4 [Puccinia sorghi]|uniref:Uncharacterized protein n=1 Tax=Puccinia sorghi TaxID=27349 RepID=A0A0L6ULJ8_9BASI|nr:uncharacterized protein VP01_5177g4 [Puccinia sorghi]